MPVTFKPVGSIPAALLPFHPDFSVDDSSFCSHLRDLAETKGVTAITVNGHASEVTSCTFEEQTRVMALAAEAVGSATPLIAGVR